MFLRDIIDGFARFYCILKNPEKYKTYDLSIKHMLFLLQMHTKYIIH